MLSIEMTKLVAKAKKENIIAKNYKLIAKDIKAVAKGKGYALYKCTNTNSFYVMYDYHEKLPDDVLWIFDEKGNLLNYVYIDQRDFEGAISNNDDYLARSLAGNTHYTPETLDSTIKQYVCPFNFTETYKTNPVEYWQIAPNILKKVCNSFNTAIKNKA